MTRGEQEKASERLFQDLSDALLRAREAVRRHEAGDLLAPPCSQALKAFATEVADSITRLRAWAEKLGISLQEERKACEGVLAEARQTWPSAKLPPKRVRPKETRQTGLPFSRAESYTFEDKVRRLRFRVTVEDLIPE
jgi:hypothetical protein